MPQRNLEVVVQGPVIWVYRLRGGKITRVEGFASRQEALEPPVLRSSRSGSSGASPWAGEDSNLRPDDYESPALTS